VTYRLENWAHYRNRLFFGWWWRQSTTVCYHLQVDERETPTQLDPLERANLNHRTLALSKRPNRACVSFPSSDVGNRSSFRNVVFHTYLQFRTADKAVKHGDSERSMTFLTRSTALRWDNGVSHITWALVVMVWACVLRMSAVNWSIGSDAGPFYIAIAIPVKSRAGHRACWNA
jgi:hypothetical protein